MSKSGFNQRSCTSPPTSRRREGPLTVRGLTAGGSGNVSTEAIVNNRPKTQIMHDLDFIPALHQKSNDNRISGAVPLRSDKRRSFSAPRTWNCGEPVASGALTRS
jgi:hypothetical protein